MPAEFGGPQSGWSPKDPKVPSCHQVAKGQQAAVKFRDAAVRDGEKLMN